MKDPDFWQLIKVPRVRYFGPNPPGPLGPDNSVELLRPDPPAELGTDPAAGDSLIAPAGALPSTMPPTVSGGIIPPGITGPLQHPPQFKLPPSTGSSPPILPSVLPPIALPPAPIPTIDENPTGPAPDVSAMDLPPGCFTPSSALPPDIPITAGARDLPDPPISQLPGGQGSSGILADLLPSLPVDGCFTPEGSGAGSKPNGAADGASGPSAASAGIGGLSDYVRSASPTLKISAGEGHRMANSVLASMSRKLELLAHRLAKNEVERAFHLYQANRRVLFNTFGRR